MALPLQITFRNMNHSEEVEDWVRSEAEKLETFYKRITDCRVAIEVPHKHHRKGKPLHVRIDLKVPGKEIVIKREPVVMRRSLVNRDGAAARRIPSKLPHADLRLVIHAAFKAAARSVHDFAKRRQGKVKSHALSASL